MHPPRPVTAEPSDRSRSAGSAGFSLVELLIVIVVLGILAAVAVFSVRGISSRGEVTTCNEDERVLQTAVEAYFAQSGAVAIPTSDPAVPGLSGLTAEDTLVESRLLAHASSLHDVASDGEVSAAAGSGC